MARKLEERLALDGHAVTVEQLEAVEPLDLSATTAALKSEPPIDVYDAVVLGSPVNGGRMSAPMKTYLDQIPSLQGKRIAILLTHFFFQSWGANQTVEQMTEASESKGAMVCGVENVRWLSLRRRKQISEAVERLARCLQPWLAQGWTDEGRPTRRCRKLRP